MVNDSSWSQAVRPCGSGSRPSTLAFGQTQVCSTSLETVRSPLHAEHSLSSVECVFVVLDSYQYLDLCHYLRIATTAYPLPVCCHIFCHYLHIGPTWSGTSEIFDQAQGIAGLVLLQMSLVWEYPPLCLPVLICISITITALNCIKAVWPAYWGLGGGEGGGGRCPEIDPVATCRTTRLRGHYYL